MNMSVVFRPATERKAVLVSGWLNDTKTIRVILRGGMPVAGPAVKVSQTVSS
jgi:hypothetical protein